MIKLMGLTALMLVIASIGLLTKAEAKTKAAFKQCPELVQGVHFYKKVTWKWQDRLDEPRKPSVYTPTTSCRYTRWAATLWRTRAKARKSRFVKLTKENEPRRLSDRDLAWHAKWVATHGGVLGTRWGAATPHMIEVNKELVRRAFAPYGRSEWALCIVDRESGFNSHAINATSGAASLSQMIPEYHDWVNYPRAFRDPAYAVWAFKKLSRNGQLTSPWDGAPYDC